MYQLFNSSGDTRVNSIRWLLDISVQLFWSFLRDSSLGCPKNCCNLAEILVLWASIVQQCLREVYREISAYKKSAGIMNCLE
jgi:hypothetical protein